MAHLFIVENNVARPNLETLLIEPYKTLWERDTSKDKSRAIKEFTYVEFMVSKKKSNPYAGYDRENRKRELKKLLKFPQDWDEDIYIVEAMRELEKFQTEASSAYTFLIAAEEAASKIKSFYMTFDLNERNTRTGVPIYKPKEITSAINDAEANIRNLHSLKEKVEQELFEATKTRNNRDINPFEV